MRDAFLALYPWIKALHVIAVIAWMAGMMYLPRLFVHHMTAAKGGEAEAFFVRMERRLLKGIIKPSIILVWLFGLAMVYLNPALLSSAWFLVKLAVVIAISGIHGFYVQAQRKFERGERPRTEKFWRIMNEIPFALMIIAIIMVVVRPF